MPTQAPAHARPQRLFTANIEHNPRTWMGIWTPQGWRVHRKRWGHATRAVRMLSGDGKSTFFPQALLDPDTGRVEWRDDLHLQNDPFTDDGIYPADPRVEYPVGQPRWAVSHTLLCYPVADHTLWTHEYTWDLDAGHLWTHFRRHVHLEPARTDAGDGRTVRVGHTPISRMIEGNCQYPLENSAVYGVWSSPDKQGVNHYARRIVQQLGMHNGVYIVAPRTPVVQCHGIWRVLPGDAIDGAFAPVTGECTDPQMLIDRCQIPLDHPKLGMIAPVFEEAHSRLYEGTVPVLAAEHGDVDAFHLVRLRERRGQQFAPGRVGFAGDGSVDADRRGYYGYDPRYDLDADGIIGESDEAIVANNLGRRVRRNHYINGYFGGDWLSVGAGTLDLEHHPGVQIIADYTYGAGYDADAGEIRLHNTPGPDKPVWVEYFHDAPAEAGENNIRVHLYRERDEP